MKGWGRLGKAGEGGPQQGVLVYIGKVWLV